MSQKNYEAESRKVYRAKNFALSVMSCPSCHLTLQEAVEKCPRCDYTGQVSMARFPFAAPALERFIDPEQFLSEGDRGRINRSLNTLSKKFPQVRLCFCILNLSEGVDLREFGFWLLNASPVNGPEEAKMRPWTILIIVDDLNGNISVTPGYAIEPFLSDQAWNLLMRKERQFFFARDYVTAFLKLIEGTKEILREGAERADRVVRNDRRKKSSNRER